MKNTVLKIFSLILSLIILCSAFCACAKNKAPSIESVRERFSYLLDNSYEINEIFWGDGLPTIVYGSDEDKQYKVYDEKTFDGYEYVRDDCKYQTVEQIKMSAQKIYTKAYLDNIYGQIFDGYMIDEQNITAAKYVENTKGFFCYAFDDDMVDKLIYDHTTMKIIKPSRANYVNVEVKAHKEGDSSNIFTIKVSFALQDGEWYLNSPSF